MRDRQLHAALRAFSEEAAWTLAAETAGGAELPFDILEERNGRGGPTLYCYRPDTAGFIADRAALIARLENWPPAVQALSARTGVDAYLRSRGHTHVPSAARGGIVSRRGRAAGDHDPRGRSDRPGAARAGGSGPRSRAARSR